MYERKKKLRWATYGVAAGATMGATLRDAGGLSWVYVPAGLLTAAVFYFVLRTELSHDRAAAGAYADEPAADFLRLLAGCVCVAAWFLWVTWNRGTPESVFAVLRCVWGTVVAGWMWCAVYTRWANLRYDLTATREAADRAVDRAATEKRELREALAFATAELARAVRRAEAAEKAAAEAAATRRPPPEPAAPRLRNIEL